MTTFNNMFCHLLLVYVMHQSIKKYQHLHCALSKSGTQTTIGSSYVLADRHNGNHKQYMICHLLLVHVMCLSSIKYQHLHVLGVSQTENYQRLPHGVNMFWQSDRMTSSTIDDRFLTLSTCNVLVIYKVLALACAWSKSDSITTTVSKYVPVLRQKYSFKPQMISPFLLVHVMCQSFVLALACGWSKSDRKTTIDSISLTLSTCNVLVIYKVLALTLCFE